VLALGLSYNAKHLRNDTGVVMIDQNNPSEKPSENRPRWNWIRLLLVIVPTMIPFAYLYFSERKSWTLYDVAIILGMIAGYWLTVFVVATRLLRSRHALQAARLASPLIEVPLSADLRARLSRFAASREQKPAVVAFDLLDQELPRFELDDERDRARRDNEHLRQQAGQGAFLVAVTTEILRRLLLLSGAHEEDRKFWRAQISETAARIVSDALEQRMPLTEQSS
jgi:hypothetical protein